MENLSGNFKIGVISSSLLTKGLRLAGVTAAYTAGNTQEVEAALGELLARKDIGLIILTSGAKGMVRDSHLLTAIDTSIMPVIITVDGYGEKEEPEDILRRLIKKVVGIDIYGNA